MQGVMLTTSLEDKAFGDYIGDSESREKVLEEGNCEIVSIIRTLEK
jgi:hypothetical protein